MRTAPEDLLKEEGDFVLAKSGEGGEPAADGSFQVAAGGAVRRHFGRFLKDAVSGTVTPPAQLKPLSKEPPPRNDIIDADDASLNDPAVTVQPDVVAPVGPERLEAAFPHEARVANGQPNTPGKPVTDSSGGRFLDRDLTAKGTGRVDEGIPDTIWREAIEETPGVVDDLAAIEQKTGRKGWPKPAEFWNTAFNLPDRARYWYEISAEYFRAALPDLSTNELGTMLRVVAATSPLANPHDNLRRAVGAYSLHLRGDPITTDLTTPETVAQALKADGVSGPKVTNFGDTFLYLLGLGKNPPLSTNDRQVASSFGLEGDDIVAYPRLYEALSRFYMKMRDQVNAGNLSQEAYETWQIQALGWVEERIRKDKAKGKVSTNDDYVMAAGKIVDDLIEAGVKVPDRKLTKEVLMDPRVAGIMSTTMEEMRKRPVATIEVATTQTDVGKEAIGLVDLATSLGNNAAVKQYDTITHQSLDAIILRREGKDSIADRVLGAIIGVKPNLSRMEKGMGTFEGAISANVRIPLPSHLTETQRGAFLSIMGRGLLQDAAPAAVFKPSNPRLGLEKGYDAKTFSVFVRDTELDDADILDFQTRLPDGHDVSARKVPNGIEIQVNPRFGDDGAVIGPTVRDIGMAANGIFHKEKMTTYSFDYKSDYYTDGDYNGALEKIRSEILDGEAKRLASRFKVLANGTKPADEAARVQAARSYLRHRGVPPKAAGNASAAQAGRIGYRERIDSLASVEKEVARVAQGQYKKQKKWIAKHSDRLKKAEAKRTADAAAQGEANGTP